jgi:2-polyprenyl-3-methyl-5-hydroxy-6-metoxy-1,4-benzoquinol methylase
LEIGCGAGPNLDMLSKHGHVKGLEYSEPALEIVRRTLPGIAVKKGWLPDNVDVWEQSFDLVCAFDVLEHVEDDEGALYTMRKILKKGGFLFLALPAYQWLFGPYDSSGGHYRRYGKKDIMDKLRRNGLFHIYQYPFVSLCADWPARGKNTVPAVCYAESVAGSK